MAEPPANDGSLSQRLDQGQLLEWIREQRWFASKSQTLAKVDIIEEAALDGELVGTSYTSSCWRAETERL